MSTGRDGDAFVIENNHPAIIDQRTFDAVQRRLVERRTATTPHQDGGGFVFTGIVQVWQVWRSDVRCDQHGTRFGIGATATPTAANATGTRSDKPNCWTRCSVPSNNGSATRRRWNGCVPSCPAKLKQRTKTTNVDDLRKQLSKVDTKLTTARRNMALADGDDLRREYETVVRELRSERERLDASIQDAQKPRGRTPSGTGPTHHQAIDMLSRLRSTLLAAPVVQATGTAAMVHRQGGSLVDPRPAAKAPYRLEHGKVHLRSDMWLTEAEADNLFRY